jgi:hypothetical protein
LNETRINNVKDWERLANEEYQMLEKGITKEY